MTRDAFRRLALFAGATLFWVGVLAVAEIFGPWKAAFAAIAGLTFGALLTLEMTPPPPEARGRFRRFGNEREEAEDDEDLTDRHA